MKRTIDISPKTHLISSLRHQKIEAWIAMAELIDNSLDAGATIINISIESDKITIQDNGRGISPEDITSIVQMGNHKRYSNSAIGEYGIGAKEAILGLGSFSTITTIRNGNQCVVNVDWNRIEKSGDWKVEVDETSTDKPNGTLIEITDLLRSYRVASLKANLAYTFYPALLNGVKIYINAGAYGESEQIKPCEFPKLRSRIVDSAESPNGDLEFEVQAGLVENNPRNSFLIHYKHRIIESTNQPNMDYLPGPKFMAHVTLKRGNWDVLKHKNGLKETAKSEWLYNKLNEICSDLLQQCHQMTQDIKLEAVSSILNELFELDGGTIKSRKDNLGTPLPFSRVSFGRTNNTVSENKGRSKKRKAGGISLRIDSMGKDMPMGDVSYQRNTVIVRLNSDYAYIEENRDNNELMAFAAVVILFQDLSCQDLEDNPNQLLLKLDSVSPKQRFYEAAAKIFLNKRKLRAEQFSEISS